MSKLLRPKELIKILKLQKREDNRVIDKGFNLGLSRAIQTIATISSEEDNTEIKYVRQYRAFCRNKNAKSLKEINGEIHEISENVKEKLSSNKTAIKNFKKYND